jgi:hypothetical protein
MNYVKNFVNLSLFQYNKIWYRCVVYLLQIFKIFHRLMNNPVFRSGLIFSVSPLLIMF